MSSYHKIKLCEKSEQPYFN